jgi:hypothetical protein
MFMNLQDRTLVRKLAFVLVLKVVVLVALWWFFVHEQRVAIDGAGIAAQLLGPAATQKQE